MKKIKQSVINFWSAEKAIDNLSTVFSVAIALAVIFLVAYHSFK